MSNNITQSDNKKFRSEKSLNFPTMRVIFIVISFLFGILDMILLSQAVEIVFKFDPLPAMGVAFLLATIANFMALTWGQTNGEKKEAKLINKESKPSFIGWLIVGIMYAAFRIVKLCSNLEGLDEDISNLWETLVGEALQIVILAVSYITTGLLISDSARTIWDADAVEYRAAKKKFELEHDLLAQDSADLQEKIGILQDYEINYSILNKQKDKIENGIIRTERGTMADVAGRVLSRHHEVSPKLTHEIINSVMAKREQR